MEGVRHHRDELVVLGGMEDSYAGILHVHLRG